MGLQIFFHVVFIQSIFFYKSYKPVHRAALKKKGLNGQGDKVTKKLPDKKTSSEYK